MNLLSEIMIIEKLKISETERVILIKETFKRNNVTTDKFRETKEYYRHDPDYWIKIYDKAAERMKSRIDSLSNTNIPDTESD